MLGKLLKHEWRDTWKVPALLIVVMLVISLLAGLPFALPIWESDWMGLPFIAISSLMLFYFAIIVVSVGVELYFTVRYYKSMFTNEGYLTHTLPVSPRTLLLSKAITFSTWNVIVSASIIAGVCIFVGAFLFFMSGTGEIQLGAVWETMKMLLQSEEMAGWQAFLAGLVVMTIAGCISGSMMIIGAVTLGQMVRKHRILGAIGAYFAIQSILQILTMVSMVPFYVQLALETGTTAVEDTAMFGFFTPNYMISTALFLAVSVGLFIWSEYLVRRKLDLE